MTKRSKLSTAAAPSTDQAAQIPLFADPAACASTEPRLDAGRSYSQYVVYVDESGDHSLESIDPQYPVFVLAFCVFHKNYYASTVVPALERFKFKHFGHDVVVLHETDIRKERGNFRFSDRTHKHAFLDELTGLIEQNNFILIASVIDKARLRERSQNPYHLALGFCLETLHELMQEKRQDALTTHVVVECRGKKEDAELELEFRRMCDGENRFSKPLPFEVIFADKKTNSTGLQLADLVARPIGLSVVRPDQPNRAFDVLTRKLFCSGGRRQVGTGFNGWGLKIHPAPESERPR
jgi:hypothetical protein